MFILGDIQTPAGYSPGTLLWLNLLEQVVGLHDLPRTLPTSTILCFYYVADTSQTASTTGISPKNNQAFLGKGQNLH